MTFSRTEKLSDVLAGVADDAMIHLSPVPPGSLSGAISAISYWARFGDVKQLSIAQYQALVVGGGAPASTTNSVTLYFKLPLPPGTFEIVGVTQLGRFPEYGNLVDVVPDGWVLIRR